MRLGAFGMSFEEKWRCGSGGTQSKPSRATLLGTEGFPFLLFLIFQIHNSSVWGFLMIKNNIRTGNNDDEKRREMARKNTERGHSRTTQCQSAKETNK